MPREQQEEAFDDDEVLDETIEVPQDDIGHIKAALRVLGSRLTKKAKELDGLDQEKAATDVRADVAELTEVMPRVLEAEGLTGFTKKQRRLGRKALGLYATNLKAAKGTNRGISRTDWSAVCEEAAKEVEGRLIPMLADPDEQTSLVEEPPTETEVQ